MKNDILEQCIKWINSLKPKLPEPHLWDSVISTYTSQILVIVSIIGVAFC